MYQYKIIKETLIKLIGKMNSGEKLPSRTELCRILQTTRTTLDRAICELVSEGVLSSHKGSGTYVVGLLDGKLPYVDNWGVIVPSTEMDVFPELINGIKKTVLDYGVNVIACNSENSHEKQESYIERLLATGVSGFIIVPVVSKNAETSHRLYKTLIQSNIPFVFCNRAVEGIEVPIVKSTDFYGGYIATKHLIEQGYKRIAYIATQKYQTSVERCQGYINALLEENIEINRKNIYIPTYPTEECYFNQAICMLNSDNPPDAFFCFNDGIAEEIYRAVKVCGKEIGTDVGVMGYDNTDKARTLVPPLTSMAYQSEMIGEKAAEILWKLIHEKNSTSDFEYYIFQTVLVERESCKKQK